MKQLLTRVTDWKYAAKSEKSQLPAVVTRLNSDEKFQSLRVFENNNKQALLTLCLVGRSNVWLNNYISKHTVKCFVKMESKELVIFHFWVEFALLACYAAVTWWKLFFQNEFTPECRFFLSEIKYNFGVAYKTMPEIVSISMLDIFPSWSAFEKNGWWTTCIGLAVNV